jgi:cystathionine gamma-synthase
MANRPNTRLPTSNVRRTDWPSSTSRPVVTPLQMSVVYASADPDALDDQYTNGTGYTYAREGHPNADVLAAKIDRLEGAPDLFDAPGIITGSGMSAVGATFLGLLKAGDHVVGGDQLYGRTLRLMTQDLPKLGIETTLADPTDARAVEAALRPNTRMIVVEVISNPTIRVADMEGIAAIANARGILLVVDNTFTTPRLYQPFANGADIVIHSVTKLLAGHSDATLGYIACKDPAHRTLIDTANASWGMTPSPFDCWLAERGMHSFDLRFDRAQATAARLADALAEVSGVARVIYPTRPDHPDHNRAKASLAGAAATCSASNWQGAGRRPTRSPGQPPRWPSRRHSATWAPRSRTRRPPRTGRSARTNGRLWASPKGSSASRSGSKSRTCSSANWSGPRKRRPDPQPPGRTGIDTTSKSRPGATAATSASTTAGLGRPSVTAR